MPIYYGYPGVSAPEFSVGVKRNYKSLYKKFGTISSALTNVDTTILYKFAMSSDFSAVRLSVYNTQVTPLTGVKMCIAVTETNAQGSSGTDPVRSQPIIGGTAYPSVVTATDERGWIPVTWAGAATVTIGAGTNAAPTYVTSDWISINSIVRTDGGSLPILMVRLHSPLGTPFTGVPGSNYTSDPATHGDRTLYCASSAGDKVTAPAVGDSFASGPAGVSPVCIEVQYNTPVKTLMVIGDSITQNDQLVADKFSSWGQRACVKRTTSSDIWEFWNQGKSSQIQQDFWEEAKTYMTTSGNYPSVAVFAAWSPNGTINRSTISVCKKRVVDFMQFCETNGIYPILFTSGPNDTYDTATDALRLEIVNFAKGLSQQGLCGLLDGSGLWSQGVTPDRWKTEYKQDNVHPNEAGVELAAINLARILP